MLTATELRSGVAYELDVMVIREIEVFVKEMTRASYLHSTAATALDSSWSRILSTSMVR